MNENEFYKLKKGSVVLFGNRRTPRIVRKTGVSKNNRNSGFGKLACVEFAIKRCSWTGRPYTVYTKTDVMGMCEYTDIVVQIPKNQDYAFRYESNNKGKPKISCCQARVYL